MRLAVDVNRRAQLPGQRFFVLSARDGDDVETHLRGVLHSEMTQPTNAMHRDEIAGARAGISQRIEGGQTGTQ